MGKATHSLAMGYSAQQLTEQYADSSQIMASPLMGLLDLKLGPPCFAKSNQFRFGPTLSGVGLLLMWG